MKKSMNIFWAAVARQDLSEIIKFISKDSPDNARIILNKIKIKTAELNKLPNLGCVVPELLQQGISTYQEIIVKPWRGMYRIEGKSVYIVSVIDSRRNMEDILLARLLR